MERFRNRSTSAVDEIAEDVDAILITMEGEETGGGATLPGAPPLAVRVRQLYTAIEAATSLPTTEQRQLTRLSHEKLAEQIDRVNQLKGSEATCPRTAARRGGCVVDTGASDPIKSKTMKRRTVLIWAGGLFVFSIFGI